MIQARSTLNGELVLAAPGRTAICPQCAAPVRAKCGEIVAHHFAHISADDCDTWSEGESQWHHEWKLVVPEHQREVVIGNHRADIVAKGGVVVELQHSHLAPARIRERENHYGDMVWIFDVDGAHISVYASRRIFDDYTLEPNYRAFSWRNPRFHMGATRRPTFIDKGGECILLLHRLLFDAAPYGGTGWLIPRTDVKRWLRDGVKPRTWPQRIDEYEDSAGLRDLCDFDADPTSSRARNISKHWWRAK